MPDALGCAGRLLSDMVRMHGKLADAGLRAESGVRQAMPHGEFGMGHRKTATAALPFAVS